MHWCTNQLICSSMISNVELQLCIYKKLALTALAQDNWLVNSTFVQWTKLCTEWATCAQVLTNSS